MSITKNRLSDIIDLWMAGWQNGSLGADYAIARRFRDFWIEKVSDLSLSEAWATFNRLDNNKQDEI